MNGSQGRRPDGGAHEGVCEIEDLVIVAAPVAPFGRGGLTGLATIIAILVATVWVASSGSSGPSLDGAGAGPASVAASAAPSPIASIEAPAPMRILVTDERITASVMVHRTPTIVRVAVVVADREIAVARRVVMTAGSAAVSIPAPSVPFQVDAEITVERIVPGEPEPLLAREPLVLGPRTSDGLIGLGMRTSASTPVLLVDAVVPSSVGTVDVVVRDDMGAMMGSAVARPDTATWGGVLLGAGRIRVEMELPGSKTGDLIEIELVWTDGDSLQSRHHLVVAPGSTG
jgi:hypothetical protein